MRRQGEFTPDTLDDIYRQLFSLQEQIRTLSKTPSVIERLNPVTFPDPVEGQVAVDSRSNCFIYYANGAWREKCSAIKNIKVFSDRKVNKVEDGAFRFAIDDDLDETLIEHVQAFNGTTGSGTTTAQIRNITRGINILSSPLDIASGATVSDDGEVIDEGGPIATPNNMVFKDDMIWINVTAAGNGSKGLGVYITFHGPKVNVEP